ncbi:hypothetical protein BDP55DRAFT_104084 [Colletotrichum godetiae]|uniref:Ankyrin repeat protein n=1 Tax=Colletotrichum godetiae TaxID=1209918 RepID=A0AAJ0ETP2_9PEZI|nr:uncharacterized protein BDP55DRAFT_104084 [Colletotrichum godetiae]KAK1676416.1 hypothetical protein BDP55DRAFT_104084 [Colletotrichum godetiae]
MLLFQFKVPFLNFETHDGHQEMAQALENRSTEGVKPFGYGRSMMAPGFQAMVENQDVPLRSDQSSSASQARRQVSNDTDGSILTSPTRTARRKTRTRVDAAVRRLGTRLQNWHARRPALPEEPATEVDLERQSPNLGQSNISSPDDEGVRLETLRITAPIAANEQELPVLRDSSGNDHGSFRGTQSQREEPVSQADPEVAFSEVVATSNNNDLSSETSRVFVGRSAEQYGEWNTSQQQQPLLQPGTFHEAGISEQQRQSAPRLAQRRKKELYSPPPGNLHEQLIRGYFSSTTQGFQPRRTLDQYIYSHTESTPYRDNDQVIYRYTRSHSFPEPLILMVDQLWLWILGDETVISCCPLRWNSWVARDSQNQTDITTQPSKPPPFIRWFAGWRQQIPAYERRPRGPNLMESTKTHDMWPEIDPEAPLTVPYLVIQHLSKQGREAIGSVNDLASLITTHCVELLNPHHVADEHLFFEFFDRSIVQASDNVTSAWRIFKDAVRMGSHDVIEITEETELMIEVDDILDELHTMKLVLTKQRTIIRGLNTCLSAIANENPQKLWIKTRVLDDHLLHIDQMEEAAKKAETSLFRLMDLKQKRGSLSEAYYARESARDTAKQGKTVIVFTVVTILFLPVSFIAAMFAINTNGYPLDENDRIPFDYLVKHIMTIGLGLSIPLIIIAFNVDRIARWFGMFRPSQTNLWQWGVAFTACIGLFLALLGPIWASQLSSGIKVAISIVVTMASIASGCGYIAFHIHEAQTSPGFQRKIPEGTWY